jgi:hypothetical protein
MDVDPKFSAISHVPAATLAAEQSSATAETDELRLRILERILESSQPIPPPPGWGRFGSSRFVQRFSCESGELLSRLGQHFT